MVVVVVVAMKRAWALFLCRMDPSLSCIVVRMCVREASEVDRRDKGGKKRWRKEGFYVHQ